MLQHTNVNSAISKYTHSITSCVLPVLPVAPAWVVVLCLLAAVLESAVVSVSS